MEWAYAQPFLAGGLSAISEVNMMYSECRFPEQMYKSIFITIPKIKGTAKCDKNRTISLMSHVTKLVLMVIMNRIRARTLSEISEVQYGVMPDRKNAIFVLRRLVERVKKKKKYVYVCFIDNSKAFDTVKYEPLIELLQSLDIDPQDVKLLASPHLFVLYTEMIMRSIDDMEGIKMGGGMLSTTLGMQMIQ